MPTIDRDRPDDGAGGHDPRAPDACRNSAEPGIPPDAVSSEALLRGRSQLAIRHHQQVYFLRQTRYGKLILTK